MSNVQVASSGWKSLIQLQLKCVSLVIATLLEQSMAAECAPRYTNAFSVVQQIVMEILKKSLTWFLLIFLSSTYVCLLKVGGQCPCKDAVTGRQCSDCLPGWFGLSASNPNGCMPCNCSDLGVIKTSTGAIFSCNQHTGQCQCKPHVTGKPLTKS